MRLKDRVVQNFQLHAPILLIDFADGSKMTVAIAECNSAPLQEGGRIRQVSEDQTKVIVRDKNNQVEYLG